MKISRYWLEQFVDLADISNQEFSRLFNIRTAEIDGIESAAEQFAHMVIGQIKSISPHPNAEKLRVTQTDIGDQIVQIVCGAPNIKEGMKVIVALPGSKVRWHGEGDLIELKEAELRGVKSIGMICGGDEVGVPSTVDGVEDMSQLACRPGTPLAEALGKDDTIIEIDNKSLTHRPDLWGHYGLARECAVIWDKKLQVLPIYQGSFGKQELTVRVEDDRLCPRYIACHFSLDAIKDETYLANYLARIGHNSHGILVDLTNYIMHELGQPLHVFDAEKVQGNITIRPAKQGEKIVTLDGIDRELSAGMLVIVDEKKILAIAGVMGGIDSAISENTKEIILEAANFDPTSIRVTAQKLSLRTDAVQRYEKSLDPHLAELAAKRFFLLLKQCAEITIQSKVADHFPTPPKPLKFTVDSTHIANRIGAPVTKAFITKTLKALDFAVIAKGEKLALTVPSFRATKDISSEADIIEEIARFYGYEKIEPKLPQVQLTLPPKQPWQELEKQIKLFLAHSCHLSEVYHYSFYGPKELQKFEFAHDHIVLKNSLSEEHTHLRTTLLPGMLDGLVKNSALFSRVATFEVGKVYLPTSENDLPNERSRIAVLYSEENNVQPFYQVKTSIEALLNHLAIPFRTKSYQPKPTELALQKGRALEILVADKVLGYIYELSARIRSKYKITSKVAFAEIDFEVLLEYAGQKAKTFKPIPKFPSKLFDVSVVVDQAIEAGIVLASISKLNTLIEKVELFDVFTDTSLGEQKKALAFKVTLQAGDKTLTDQDMHIVQKMIFDHLVQKYQGVIRGL
ncbi:MAG: phenylalanine--tRNA ligase subunit beta [Candidatus Abawacabacteria bacterium]|nr:phenylalanine--tRNA ligase subunit beta [Candidatus Abawacabacteria bacterium]